MNERTPKYDFATHEALKGLVAQVIVNLTEANLPEEARNAALATVLETARQFIYERPRPSLRVVR